MKHIRQRDVMGHSLTAHDRVAYIYGIRPDDGKRTPEAMSSGEVADFLLRHPEVTTRSRKVQRCLAFLEQFGPAGGRGGV